MADLKSMTLEAVLASDAATVNAAVEWAVFGDTLEATTDERLREATGGWWSAHASDELGHAVDTSGFKHNGLFAWEHRENSPWKESIEAHVAAYRHPARDFLGDWNECMRIVERLRESGYHCTLDRRESGGWTCMFLKVSGREFTDTSARGNEGRRAVAEAALKATWRPAQESP